MSCQIRFCKNLTSCNKQMRRFAAHAQNLSILNFFPIDTDVMYLPLRLSISRSYPRCSVYVLVAFNSAYCLWPAPRKDAKHASSAATATDQAKRAGPASVANFCVTSVSPIHSFGFVACQNRRCRPTDHRAIWYCAIHYRHPAARSDRFSATLISSHLSKHLGRFIACPSGSHYHRDACGERQRDAEGQDRQQQQQ